MGALSLLFPIGLLVAIATRLTATTRQRRMAALSLLGASSRQLRQVAAGEAFLPGVVGALLGVVLWLLGRPLAARASYDGTTFFPSDLTPGPFAITAVVVAIPVVCVVSASLSMRHARISPLEVARSRPSRAARPWRLVPLAAAIVGGALALWSSRSTGQVPASLVTGAYALILATLLLAGPELTRLAGRGLSRLPGAAALLAGNRLRDHPDAGFLPVAGVSLAILTTMAFVAITPAAARSLAATEEVGQRAGTGQAAVEFATPAQSARLVTELSQLPGIGVPTTVISAQVTTAGEPLSAWIGNCQAITAAAAMTDVPCGQATLIAGRDVLSRLSPDQPLELYNMRPTQVLPWTAAPDPSQPEGAHLTPPPRPAATMPAQRGVDMPDLLIDPALLDVPAEAFRPTLILFRYDSPAALESARTLVESQVQSATIATRATTFEGFSQDVRRLYDAISLASIALAIISASALVLAAAASLVERRRPYMLLRMAGTPLATLRRAVFLESATPLLVTGTLAALLGVGVGWGVTALGGDAAYPIGGVLSAPLAILLISLAVLSAVALLVERLTRGNEVHFE
ncbi:FtsX-like permease family protein [Georgenia yuyongxinii]